MQHERLSVAIVRNTLADLSLTEPLKQARNFDSVSFQQPSAFHFRRCEHSGSYERHFGQLGPTLCLLALATGIDSGGKLENRHHRLGFLPKPHHYSASVANQQMHKTRTRAS